MSSGEELEVVPVNLTCGIGDGKGKPHNKLLGVVGVAEGRRVVALDSLVRMRVNREPFWFATCSAHGTVAVRE